jgi:hypothetical protein
MVFVVPLISGSLRPPSRFPSRFVHRTKSRSLLRPSLASSRSAALLIGPSLDRGAVTHYGAVGLDQFKLRARSKLANLLIFSNGLFEFQKTPMNRKQHHDAHRSRSLRIICAAQKKQADRYRRIFKAARWRSMSLASNSGPVNAIHGLAGRVEGFARQRRTTRSGRNIDFAVGNINFAVASISFEYGA